LSERNAANNMIIAHDTDLHEAAGPSAVDNTTHVAHDRSGIDRGDSHDGIEKA
jgi:hypothetical protein